MLLQHLLINSFIPAEIDYYLIQFLLVSTDLCESEPLHALGDGSEQLLPQHLSAGVHGEVEL